MFRCGGSTQKCTHKCRHMMYVFGHIFPLRSGDNIGEFFTFPCLWIPMMQVRYIGFCRKHLYPLKHLLRSLLFSLACKVIVATVTSSHMFVLLFCPPCIFSAFITQTADLYPASGRKKIKLYIQSC